MTEETNIFDSNEYFSYDKEKEDAFTVLARAIKKYEREKGIEIKQSDARVMAEILSSGFLDEIISQEIALIRQNKRFLSAQEEQKKDTEQYIKNITQNHQALIEEYKSYQEKINILKKALMDMDGKEYITLETDEALAGAKRAYDFIYEKTKDKERASYAFDSYLLGGRYKEGDTYLSKKIIDSKQINDDIVRKSF